MGKLTVGSLFAGIGGFDLGLERAGCEVEDTFREDYEVGIHKGKFLVDYHGGCTTCGLSHSFEAEESIDAAAQEGR